MMSCGRAAWVIGVLMMTATGLPRVCSHKQGTHDDSVQLASVVSAAQNKFGVQLFRETALHERHVNSAVSPPSVVSVLSLLLAGAGWNTRRQIRRTLQWSYGREQNILAHRTLMTDVILAELGLLELSRVYIDSRTHIRDVYRRRLHDWLNTTLTTVDFQDATSAASLINQAISDLTQGQLSNVVDSSVLNEATRMLLLSAVHFKADWLYSFNASQTRRQSFSTNNGRVMVDMMVMSGVFEYGRIPELDSSFLRLPYKGRKSFMMIILPDAGHDMDSVVANLSQVDLDALVRRHATRKHIEIQIPKFSLDHATDLKTVLSKLGMPDVFDPTKADLNAIVKSPPWEPLIYVSTALHTCAISVDETGTEASAAAVMTIVSRMFDSRRNFIVDRPFLALIFEQLWNSALFIARVNDPSKAATQH